ncbi:MAG: YceI family protein [Armatimonadetes bacterium]|nr:YceI family protein [Armatimonadota bacterium]
MKNLLSASVLAVLAASALAAEKTYKVGGGMPSQQIATVESVTDFETFTGRTHKVSGAITFDKAARKISGKISIDVASLKTGIDLRDEHMRGPMWLNAEKYKSITFQVTKSKHVKGDEWDVTGKFTMHGVTKTITVRTTLKERRASKTSKAAGFKGDVLQLKAKFKVKLSDYGVKIPGMAAPKVNDTVTISITTYAQTG